MESENEIIGLLKREFDLTPYESRAYVSLIKHGRMTPIELTQRARIPRPRTYDVLKSLVGKGLLMEQPGRPPFYTVIEPKQAIKNLLFETEKELRRQLEKKRRSAEILSEYLSSSYKKEENKVVEANLLWITRRDRAFLTKYVQAIRNCKHEIVVASTDPKPPENEILEAVGYALEKGVSVRVVREITASWTLRELNRYEKVVEKGSNVSYLRIENIPLRFTIFDGKETVLVLKSETNLETPIFIDAIWIKIPQLAKILHEYFESRLWKNAKPLLPILEELKKKIKP